MAMMARAASAIAHEARQMLPPFAFFFVSFNLLALTVALLSPTRDVSVVSHAAATLGALLVGKAVLLAEMLPFVDRYRNRPLIWNTVWKAGLYVAVTLVLRLAEKLVSAATSGYGFSVGVADEVKGVDWAHFWAVQLWLALLFLVYTGFREAVREIGAERVRRMFLSGRPTARP